MDKDLWFCQKRYGWGWTPCNLKGWLVILAFMIWVIGYPVICQAGYFQFSFLFFYLNIAASTALLIWICDPSLNPLSMYPKNRRFKSRASSEIRNRAKTINHLNHACIAAFVFGTEGRFPKNQRARAKTKIAS